jgi:integrase/recombinase XerD
MKLSQGNVAEDLERWKAAYIAHCRAKERSGRTLTIYQGVLDDLTEYCRQYQDEIGIEDINRMLISNFFNEKTAKAIKGFSSSTKSLYLTVIKQFLMFISENNIDSIDLSKKLHKMAIKAEIREKPSLMEHDIAMVLNTIEKLKKEGKRQFTTYRDALLFKIPLYTGIRVEELMNVHYRDLMRDDENEVFVILIKGKGNKERYTYLPIISVEDELDTLIGMGRPVEEAIASTSWGEPIDRTHIYQALERLYKRAGIEKKGVHILRHTLARRLVDENVNLETIRDILGHTNIAITQKFYAKTQEKNKIAALKVHANGKLKP